MDSPHTNSWGYQILGNTQKDRNMSCFAFVNFIV